MKKRKLKFGDALKTLTFLKVARELREDTKAVINEGNPLSSLDMPILADEKSADIAFESIFH